MKKLSLFEMICMILLLCAATAIYSRAQVLTLLHSFTGNDGTFPRSGLVQAGDGNFYGTTHGDAEYNYGTVFKITLGGTLTTLHIFCSQHHCGDGGYPEAGLILASDGNFYGTTYYGGANGNGTVFKMTSGGTLTTLHSFCSLASCADGAGPLAVLVQDADGSLYGTTAAGGASGYGTVFKITLGGTLTTLYSFCSQSNCADGRSPFAGLVRASDGNFYGTTHGTAGYDYGTVFKITPSGTLTTLYTFCSQHECTDGAYPAAGIIQASDSDFYGTTAGGGASNEGTIFKITPSGTLNTLYSFCAQSHCSDGIQPYAGLIEARDGNFYGTTAVGGHSDDGTLFKITPGGTLTTLLSFDSVDGAQPFASLLQGADGSLYGTTYIGGAGGYGGGTVFRLALAHP